MRKYLTDEEQALLNRLKDHRANPNAFETIKTDYPANPHIRPHLSLEKVEKAEREIGFQLPPLMREIYIQIGDGGFGPGSGLLKLFGRHPKDDQAVVTTYKMLTGPDVPPEYDSWHPHHLDIVDWGCNIYSVIDCTTAEGAIYRYWIDRYDTTKGEPLHSFGKLEVQSLREWLELWLAGANLFDDYGQF